MELKQLADFVAVCRAGSFAAASRRVNTSQPGLGYQIKQLEFELDVKLLERHSRGVALTAAGTVLLDHAERVLDTVKEARTALIPFRASKQVLVRMGLSPTPARLIGRAIAALPAEMGDVEFTLREGFSQELVNQAVRGELDATVTLSSEAPPGFRSRPLYREALCLIGKAVEEQDGRELISLDDVAEMPIVAGPRGHIVRERLTVAAAAAGIRLNISQELDPSGLRRSLVLYGNQGTVAAVGVFIDEYEHGLLTARRIDPPILLEVHLLCAAHVPEAIENALVMALGAVIRPFSAFMEPAVPGL